MLLTIFNLPAKTRYVDVKSLILSKCGLKEVILDNLTSESNDTKRVTVGLAEEEDAAILVRKINGLFVDGQQLYVETIKKKAASAVMDFGGNQKEQQQPMLQQPYYQQNKFQPNYELSFAQMQQSRSQPVGAVSLGYGGMYGAAQNSSANFGYPQQMQYQSAQQQMMAQSMVGYDQRAPLGFSNQGKNPSVWSDQNDWNHAGNASAGNQISQQGRSGSRWENTGNSSNRPLNDEPARISDRDRPSRFGHDALSRDTGRSGARRDFDRDAKLRDRGRDAHRDLGRDRDQGRDGNQGRDRDQGRDRFQGRDRDQGRDRGRDAPSRDRGREPFSLARNAPFREPPVRNAPFREPPVRNAPPREHGDALYNRRAQPPRAPTKRQITPPPAIYGQHVTDSSQPMRTFSQQRGGPKPNQPWPKPQPKQKKAEGSCVPPSKRPKKIAAQKSDKPQVNVPANKNQGQVNAKKNKPADNPEVMPIRAATWRHQIASVVAKEIMQNPEHKSDCPPEQLLTGLKRGIWCRLEELFGGDFEIRMPDMLNIYREKFGSHNDTELFNQVKNLQKNGSFPATAGQKAAPVTKKAASTAQVESAPQVQPVDTTPKIPCYPEGDKRANKGIKKANANIFQDETVLLSKMKADMQKAVIDEIDEIAKEIASDLEGESNVEFKDFNEKEKAPLVVEDCKKMVTVNLAKRLLNIGPIMLRIYTVPKTVNRSKLAPVLAEFGVTSLRKSERKKPSVYYGTCETYDDHDRLCLMDSLVVDGSTVNIKPFHLTGKAEKRAIKINVGRDWLAVDKNDDIMVQELEDLDDEIDEDITNLDTDDQGGVQEVDDEQDENENEETGEPDQEVQDTEMGDDEDTNGNIKLQTNEEEEENIDQNDAENAQLVVKSETKTIKTEQIGSEPVEENENTEVDITEQIENTPEASKDNFNKADENIDFTADIKLDKQSKTKNNNSFKICEETDLEAEKDFSEVNAGDLEDFKGNIIDTIDMADLDDDDLEDW